MNQTQHAVEPAATIRRVTLLMGLLSILTLLALSAPAASLAGGGGCGAPLTQYYTAYEHKHCGPFNYAGYFLMYPTDSAGNVTRSNVCVRGEYPTSEAAIPGYDWSCGDGQAEIDFPCCMSVRGGYLNNWPYPHYAQMYYYYY